VKRYRCARRDAPYQTPTGFSLLELLIVLAVIAGLMALAWPNLRKPLNDSPLSQAAASLRELFDECRYQAILRSELTMLRVENQSSTVVMGSWEALLANQLEIPSPSSTTDTPLEAEAENTNALMGKRRPPFQFRFALPADIVVEQVVWSVSLPASSGRDDSESDPTTQNAPALDRTSDSLLNDQLTNSSDSQGSSFWYIPFTPSGLSKDVSIILRDTTTQKRIALQHQQGTGLITYIKMPDAFSGSTEDLQPIAP